MALINEFPGDKFNKELEKYGIKVPEKPRREQIDKLRKLLRKRGVKYGR
jgi:hypothetical protein